MGKTCRHPARLARNERKKIIANRVPGINIDGTDGSMNRLVNSIFLIKLIARHNDPADDFHMDEHQVIQVGQQFIGAHYNPVSIRTVNSESKTSLDWSYNATCACLYEMYDKACLCGNETCGFLHSD